MKKQVVVIRGGSAFREHADFITYLKTREIRTVFEDAPIRWSRKIAESLGDGYEVCVPEMPNKQNARYEEWKVWFERHIEFLRDDVVLVGWSLGAMFLVKYLSENTLPIKAIHIFLVATPVEYFKDEHTGEDAGDFNFPLEQLSELEHLADNITLFHSTDDFVVPYSHAETFKREMPAIELVTFEDRNHFLQAEFPELVEGIKGLS